METPEPRREARVHLRQQPSRGSDFTKKQHKIRQHSGVHSFFREQGLRAAGRSGFEGRRGESLGTTAPCPDTSEVPSPHVRSQLDWLHPSGEASDVHGQVDELGRERERERGGLVNPPLPCQPQEWPVGSRHRSSALGSFARRHGLLPRHATLKNIDSQDFGFPGGPECFLSRLKARAMTGEREASFLPADSWASRGTKGRAA